MRRGKHPDKRASLHCRRTQSSEERGLRGGNSPHVPGNFPHASQPQRSYDRNRVAAFNQTSKNVSGPALNGEEKRRAPSGNFARRGAQNRGLCASSYGGRASTHARRKGLTHAIRKAAALGCCPPTAAAATFVRERGGQSPSGAGNERPSRTL
jgi:hypothetical protein